MAFTPQVQMEPTSTPGTGCKVMSLRPTCSLEFTHHYMWMPGNADSTHIQTKTIPDTFYQVSRNGSALGQLIHSPLSQQSKTCYVHTNSQKLLRSISTRKQRQAIYSAHFPLTQQPKFTNWSNSLFPRNTKLENGASSQTYHTQRIKASMIISLRASMCHSSEGQTDATRLGQNIILH